MYDMTRSHDSSICDMTHSHSSYMCDMFRPRVTHSYASLELRGSCAGNDKKPPLSFFLSFDWLISPVCLRHAMGWLRLVGSLKLQVSFAKEPYKRDLYSAKGPIIFRSLLIVATPYVKRVELKEKQALECTATQRDVPLQHTVRHCNTERCTAATHCNALQHRDLYSCNPL